MSDMNENRSSDIAVLIATIAGQTESSNKYSDSFVKIIQELDKNQKLIEKILELSEKNDKNYSSIKDEIKQNDDFNRKVMDNVLKIIQETKEEDKKSKSILERVAEQLLEIYNGRLNTQAVYKNSVFYAGAVLTVIAIIEALLQLGILHLVWGH